MTPRDIPTRLRKTRANMLGTDDEQHYWDCHDAAAEIERLRLTDAEREAVWFFAAIDSNDSVLGSHAATLRALLERTK